MRISSAATANIALTAACVMFIALGAKRLLDGPTQSAEGTAPDPVKLVSDMQLSLKDAHVRGHHNARVVLIEFSDFECPFCGSFATDTYETLRKEFIESGRVKQAV